MTAARLQQLRLLCKTLPTKAYAAKIGEAGAVEELRDFVMMTVPAILDELETFYVQVQNDLEEIARLRKDVKHLDKALQVEFLRTMKR